MQQARESATEATLEKGKAKAQLAALAAESDKLQKSAEFLHRSSVEYTETKAALSIYQAAPEALYDRVTAVLTVHSLILTLFAPYAHCALQFYLLCTYRCSGCTLAARIPCLHCHAQDALVDQFPIPDSPVLSSPDETTE